jgi:pimeloyl-ACP methyl ester carboxylesterase
MLPAMGCDHRLYAAFTGHVLISDQTSIASCVAQVLAAAPEHFIIMGTSFGGRVALETAIAAPDRVRGLIVIGSGAKAVADPAAGERRTARMRGGDFDQAVAEMGGMVSHLPGPLGPATRDLFIAMAHDLGRERMANQAEAMATRSDVSVRLGDIACPALMLWGREDKFSPATDGMALAAVVPHGRYVEIEACGHFPTLEAPEASAAIIHHWLEDHALT